MARTMTTAPHPATDRLDPTELDKFYAHAAGNLLDAADYLIRARRTLAALGLDHSLVEWLAEDALALSDLAEDLAHPNGRLLTATQYADGELVTEAGA